MDGERDGRIDKLNDTLYSRTRYKDHLDKRTPVRVFDSPNVEDKWQTPEIDEMLKHDLIPPRIRPFMKKIFIAALIFFFATVLIAGFVFTGGGNFVSSKNVDVSVLGQTITSAGEVLDLGVSISNTNNADLEFANLSIQYPSGSRNPDNTAEPLTYSKEDLGVVKEGTETVRNIRLVLLGSTGEVKEIKFSVEYKVKGSNATFYKDKIYEITIGETPVTLTIDNPGSVTSGETFTTVVSVSLNSTEVLKNVVLKAEYPYGYGVIDATPGSVSDGNIWALGDLSPGSKKTVSIRGRLVGQDKEERTFRFYVGVSDSNSASPNPKVIIVSLLDTLAISRSSVDLSVAFNGENVDTYIAPPARPVSTTVSFQNNLPDKLLNPRLEVSLSGLALDKSSVSAGENGTYDSLNSKIVWNLVNSGRFAELNPGEGGQVSFNFSSLSGSSLVLGANDITLNFILTGTPVGPLGQSPSTVTVNETRKVKVSSQVSLSSKVLYSLGPYTNKGPMPPRVGEETTYTVTFNVGNTQGDMTDAKVTARLGPGVAWLGTSNVGTENIIYDSLSSTLTWNLGALSSGSGFSSATRELAFQVSLEPILSQISTAPVLVSNIIFSGLDTVTGSVVTINNPPLNTRLSGDPAFIQGDDIVVK